MGVRAQNRDHASARYTNRSMYVWAITNTNKLELYRELDTTTTTIWEEAFTDTVTQYYEMTVRCVANRIECYLDGELKVVAYDLEFCTGACEIGWGSSSVAQRVQSARLEMIRDLPVINVAGAREIRYPYDRFGGLVETARGTAIRIPWVKKVLDILPWLDYFENADVRVWDTGDDYLNERRGLEMRMRLWQRVYDPWHKFRGHVVVEDGIMGVMQTRQSCILFTFDRVATHQEGSRVWLDVGHGHHNVDGAWPGYRVYPYQFVADGAWEGGYMDLSESADQEDPNYVTTRNTRRNCHMRSAHATRFPRNLVFKHRHGRGAFVEYTALQESQSHGQNTTDTMCPVSTSDTYQTDGIVVHHVWDGSEGKYK